MHEVPSQVGEGRVDCSPVHARPTAALPARAAALAVTSAAAASAGTTTSSRARSRSIARTCPLPWRHTSAGSALLCGFVAAGPLILFTRLGHRRTTGYADGDEKGDAKP